MGYKKRTVKNTGEIIDEDIEIVPEAMPEIDESFGTETKQDQRKLEIAEKRRASLALARSKIIPKSQLKKQVAEANKEVENVIKGKDELLRNKQEETDTMRLKYERDRVKQLEDSLMTLQKLIAERPAEVAKPEPVVEVAVKPKYKRPSRAKVATESGSRQPQHITPKKSVEPRIVAPTPSTENLIDKSYGEQLQERLRTQAINRIMNDTFGGF